MEFVRWSNPNKQFYQRVFDLLKHEHEKVDAFGIDWLAEKLYAKKRHDHRLETVLGMLDRYGVIEGTLHPLKVKVVGPLPERLSDEELLEGKLLSDQQKLYALVQYANHEGDLKQFLNQYFGVT